MLEDKLTQYQRIRLEAYAQVNLTARGATIQEKIDMADEVALFVRDGKED